MSKVYLKDVAKIIRSKNSGPFEITMDIIFKNREDYNRIVDSGVVNEELVSKLYKIRDISVIKLNTYEAANAIKVTFPRPSSQGSIGETDMHAAQQHVPLMFIEVE
jgi:hypothetical protein